MPLPDEVARSRAHVLSWVSQERNLYADADKFKEGNPGRDMIREYLAEGFGDDAYSFLLNYLGRARLFGIDTPQGRQAMGKSLVTLTHFLETVVELHGPMPEPGHSSGEIHEWSDCPVPLAGGSP